MIAGFSVRMHKMLVTARIRQVRATARLLCEVGHWRSGRRSIMACRHSALFRLFARVIVGYQRLFASLPLAEAAVNPYRNQGHENPDCAAFHLKTNEHPRPSDYAAMFYLAPLVPQIQVVFDLGGNVGNLFYCYSKYLEFRQDLIWRIYDLPQTMAIGAAIAFERNERHIEFAGSWSAANGADILIASGSLHYFPKPLPEMIEELESKPKYVIINRTPLTDQATAATVQDAGHCRVACVLYNRTELIRGFETIGYVQVDAWQAAELRLETPGHPEYDIPSYAGLIFKAQLGVTNQAPLTSAAA